MAEMRLKRLKSRKSGIGAKGLLGPKRCRFGALEVFFSLNDAVLDKLK